MHITSNNLPSFHEQMAAENNPLDVRSRNHTLRQLKRHIKSDNATVLEVGSSSGYMLNLIRDRTAIPNVVGSDVVDGSFLKLDKEPGMRCYKFDITDCPFPDESFDGVLLINVLEHIQDDTKAMS